MSAKAFCKCQPRAQILGPCRGTQAAWTVAEGLLDQQHRIGKNKGNVSNHYFYGWGRGGDYGYLALGKPLEMGERVIYGEGRVVRLAP